MNRSFPFPHSGLCLAVGLVLFAGGTPLPLHAETPAHPRSDDSAVRAVLNAYEQAWNGHDAHAFASLFSEDADFTNVRGQAAHGRAAIERAHVPLFAKLFQGSHQTMTGSAIRFLRPDVATAEVRWEMTGAIDREGKPRPLTRGLRALVLTKEKGLWHIAVFHNMELLAPPDLSPHPAKI